MNENLVIRYFAEIRQHTLHSPNIPLEDMILTDDLETFVELVTETLSRAEDIINYHTTVKHEDRVRQLFKLIEKETVE